MFRNLQSVVLILAVSLAVGVFAGPSGSAGMQLDGTQLEATRELRLGSYDDPHTAFSDVASLVVDTEGRIYVLQRQAARISVFKKDGTYLWAIGQSGTEPGEFVSPVELGVRHDSLWVLDPGQGRITWFSPRGALHRTVAIHPTWRDSVGTGNQLAGPLADGHFYGVPTTFSATVARGLVERIPFLRLNESGAVYDTLVWLDVAPHQTVEMELGSKGEVAFMTQPIRDFTLVRASPVGDHIVIADRRVPADGRPQEFTVRRIGIGGDTLAEVAIPYTPIPLTREYLDALIEPLFIGPGPLEGRVDEVTYRTAIWKPAYLPPVEQLVVGIDGSIWLGLSTTELFERGERDWVVLSPALDQRNRLRLPSRLDVKYASVGEVWGVRLDSTGVPFVYRFGLRSGR